MAPHPDAVKLRDLVAPLAPVELPSGRIAEVRPFTFRMREMAVAIDRTTDSAEQDQLVAQLVRLCVPSLTDEEAGDLVAEQMLAIIAVAARRLDEVLGALGNVPAPADVKRPRRRSR